MHVQCKSKRAFSLVEVVIALGIISSGCVLMIGMLDVGITTFSNAIQTSVKAQILERISNDLKFQAYSNNFTTNLYFDDEGDASTNSTSAIYSATITLTPALVPSDTGSITLSQNSVATKVVVIISKNSTPTSTNTLLWSNTGT
jgi:uncharacterized protein (TIGR02598 family)